MSEIRKRIQLSPDVRVNKRIRYTEDGMAVTTLSLSPLEKEVTTAQLLDYFSTFGPVDNTHITSKGYGSVKFRHAESAAQALDMKYHSFAGHITSVTLASNRHQEKAIKDRLPAELTNVTGTYLVDLNEDCLAKILSSKYLGLMDLLSVAETCKRLKEVAKETFRREHKVLHFHSISKITNDVARRIFFNFGSVLTELKIDSTNNVNQQMDLAVTYCSNSLKSLMLNQCLFNERMAKRWIPLFNQLTTLYFNKVSIDGDCHNLFANCKSLEELTIFDCRRYPVDWELWCEKYGENTFPKLRNFKYNYSEYSDYNWEDFFHRHKTLRSVSLDVLIDCAYLLPVIAKNCGQLEELMIVAFGLEMSTVDYENALKSLLVLEHLKVLKLRCNQRNITKLMQELHLLKSLESLEIMFAADVFEFIPGLSQLKKLKVLRLIRCYGTQNLNLLGKLEQLTELKLQFILDEAPEPNFNVVGMVECLRNLETLEVCSFGFEMNKNTYLRIVHAVQGRPDRAKRSLAIKCHVNFISDDDDRHRQIVKIL